jgi:hypothetical protein
MLVQRPVRPVGVVVVGVLAEDEPQMGSPAISIRSRHSWRALPIQRSAIAFARGACTGVWMMRTPMAANTAPKAAVKLGIPVVDEEREGGGWIGGIHQQIAGLPGHPWPPPVGLAVMPARCTRRVPYSVKNNTYKRRRKTVPAWEKSAARIVRAWAARNARHVWPRRSGAGPMPASLRIFQTVDGASV